MFGNPWQQLGTVSKSPWKEVRPILGVQAELRHQANIYLTWIDLNHQSRSGLCDCNPSLGLETVTGKYKLIPLSDTRVNLDNA